MDVLHRTRPAEVTRRPTQWKPDPGAPGRRRAPPPPGPPPRARRAPAARAGRGGCRARRRAPRARPPRPPRPAPPRRTRSGPGQAHRRGRAGEAFPELPAVGREVAAAHAVELPVELVAGRDRAVGVAREPVAGEHLGAPRLGQRRQQQLPDGGGVQGAAPRRDRRDGVPGTVVDGDDHDVGVAVRRVEHARAGHRVRPAQRGPEARGIGSWARSRSFSAGTFGPSPNPRAGSNRTR